MRSTRGFARDRLAQHRVGSAVALQPLSLRGGGGSAVVLLEVVVGRRFCLLHALRVGLPPFLGQSFSNLGGGARGGSIRDRLYAERATDAERKAEQKDDYQADCWPHRFPPGRNALRARWELQHLAVAQRPAHVTPAPRPDFVELPERLAHLLLALSACSEGVVRLVQLRAQLRDGAVQEFELVAPFVAQFDAPIPGLICLSHRSVFDIRRPAPAGRAATASRYGSGARRADRTISPYATHAIPTLWTPAFNDLNAKSLW